uniref:Uncharacterized protein n=1 Tax=Cacopsylla melanoneura TaxID=428564 RepID=A0A8D8VVH4_9HEMI
MHSTSMYNDFYSITRLGPRLGGYKLTFFSSYCFLPPIDYIIYHSLAALGLDIRSTLTSICSSSSSSSLSSSSISLHVSILFSPPNNIPSAFYVSLPCSIFHFIAAQNVHDVVIIFLVLDFCSDYSNLIQN